MLGFPIQFISVLTISVLLTVYLAGWSAQSHVDKRGKSYQTEAFGAPATSNRSIDGKHAFDTNVQKELWEQIALFVCPLH